MLSRALDTHSDMQKPKDTEWIHILLSFLKTYIENSGSELLMHEEDKTTYVATLVNDMGRVASELEAGMLSAARPPVMHISRVL